MKLLRCNKCKDIFNLHLYDKSCHCGQTKGKYIDNLNAEISGPCDVLGIDNESFSLTMKWKKNDKNKNTIYFFDAFFINEKTCDSVKRIKP